MKEHRALEIHSLMLVYGAFCVAAWMTDFIAEGSGLHVWRISRAPSGVAIIISLAFIIFYSAAALFTARFTAWGAELERMLRQVLTPFSYLQIILIAVISGLVEEWFFRGLIQNSFGLMIASLCFGLAHWIPGGRLWVWSLWSFIFGIALGLIYEASGSLWLVSAIHGTVNFLALLELNRSGHRAPAIS